MIKPQDLCVGNYVYDGDKTKFPMYVIGLDINDVYLNFESNEGDVWESSYEELCGIPITEDMLKKAGFSHNGVWWRKQEEGYAVDVSVGLAYVQIEKWANGRIHSRCTCHGVRFVHELQNLFRNITKHDLKIKL